MTAPAIDTHSIEHLDHRPACDREGCDREAVWVCLAHDCDAHDFVAGFACDPCITDAQAEYTKHLPLMCACRIWWRTWRELCPRQERIR